MPSLRETAALVPRYASGRPAALSGLAEYLRTDRPISMRDVTDRIGALPDHVEFESAVVTGAALGGNVRLKLLRDGGYEFSGFMRATGVLSYEYRLTVILRNPDVGVLLMAQASGEAFGSDSPGERQDNWDEHNTDPTLAESISGLWPDVHRCTMDIRRESELSGLTGSALEVVRDLGLIVLAGAASPGLAACIVLGAELRAVGADVPGLGGVVGLVVVEGSVVIWGPTAIVPAFVAGVAAGAVVDDMVHVRRLRPDEIDFADQVFRGTIDYERVRLTNLSGIGGRAFVAPALNGMILVNIGNSADAPVGTVMPNYPVPGQLLIHELTHAWQLQHTTADDGYVPGWICNGIVDGTYTPGPAGPAWGSFGIEEQASIVDQWFAGGMGQIPPTAAPAMDPNSAYFPYISGDIRNAVI